MSHGSYWVRRYQDEKKVVVMVIVMAVILVGAAITFQMSKPDTVKSVEAPVQRSYLQKQQDEYLQDACLDGKDACDKAKEEIRRQNCELFGECLQKPNRR
jgi:type II secretory pathway pseudopilin PulG